MAKKTKRAKPREYRVVVLVVARRHTLALRARNGFEAKSRAVRYVRREYYRGHRTSLHAVAYRKF